MLRTKRGLFLLLALVFVLNWAETSIESLVASRHQEISRWGHEVAVASNGLEGGFSFEHHDVANGLLVYGYSISYFFLLPVLFCAAAAALALRPQISALRVFSLAIALDYWMSLPFFLLFPVPERWAHSGSEAVLLSDLWSSGLIEAIRPISGLDNSFPSFHVSMSTVIALTCFVFRLRLWRTVATLSVTIMLSTFVLGIHWIPDIVAGLALGILSVMLARRIDQGLTASPEGPAQLADRDAAPAPQSARVAYPRAAVG
jgi:membrane-associated phospholipid phosphatase